MNCAAPNSSRLDICLSSGINELLSVSETARLDAEILLALALGKTRGFLYAHPEHELNSMELERYGELIERRQRYEPVAYIVGEKEFWSLPFKVTPDVLIPRPETELLVEKSLSLIPEDVEKTIADLGTGCGTVAVAIAKERPLCHVVATDASAAALRVANQNALMHSLFNIDFIQGQWCEALAGLKLDVIVSNPPYVSPLDPHAQSQELCHEPHTALYADKTGLDNLQQIIEGAGRYLKFDGWLAVEHGFQQQTAVKAMFQQNNYLGIEIFEDPSMRPRVTIGNKAAH